MMEGLIGDLSGGADRVKEVCVYGGGAVLMSLTEGFICNYM